LDVEQGKEEQMPVDVIEKALEFRNKSSYDKAIQDTFTAKLVQAMRMNLVVMRKGRVAPHNNFIFYASDKHLDY